MGETGFRFLLDNVAMMREVEECLQVV